MVELRDGRLPLGTTEDLLLGLKHNRPDDKEEKAGRTKEARDGRGLREEGDG